MKVGVLGAGQLGRMLALAGYPLGLRFRFLDPTEDTPARHVGQFLHGDYQDAAILDRFVEGLNVATLEFESIPVSAVEWLARRVPTWPPPGALAVAQDRAEEKALFARLDIPTAPYRLVRSLAELQEALAALGPPAILKTRCLGYDGKGQVRLRAAAPAGAAAAWEAIGGRPAILERTIDFDREVSVLAVRSVNGAEAFYPLVENEHRDGILNVSRAPAPHADAALHQLAHTYARRVLEALDYVGVLCLELFQVGGKLVANEIAPRVHNSGHWTIEGARTSQFENHLRAVLGWPLGPTDARGHAAMLNLIGHHPPPATLAGLSGVHVHLYDKAPRPGRKLGHLTVVADTTDEIEKRLAKITDSIGELGTNRRR